MFWWGPDLWVILDGKELKNTRCDKIWEGSWRQDAFGCYFMCLSVNLSLSLRWKLLTIRTCLTPAFWFDFSRCSRSQDPLWGLLNGSHNPAHLLSFNAYVGSYWHVCFQKWSFICSDGGWVLVLFIRHLWVILDGKELKNTRWWPCMFRTFSWKTSSAFLLREMGPRWFAATLEVVLRSFWSRYGLDILGYIQENDLLYDGRVIKITKEKPTENTQRLIN